MGINASQKNRTAASLAAKLINCTKNNVQLFKNAEFMWMVKKKLLF